jgi:hypothetical protein
VAQIADPEIGCAALFIRKCLIDISAKKIHRNASILIVVVTKPIT